MGAYCGVAGGDVHKRSLGVKLSPRLSAANGSTFLQGRSTASSLSRHVLLA